MNRNLISKIFIILLILLIFFIYFFTIDSHDINFKQEYYQLISEEKIMEYDVISNEIKEVDMKELKQLIERQDKSTNNVKNYNTISAYNPNSENQKLITPLSESSAQRIKNTSIYPYRTTCKVIAKNNENEDIQGTASIVGPRAALTAAHCIFDEKNGNAVYKNWTIYPGFNETSYHGTACGFSKVYYSSKWMETHSYEYDWAICVLELDVGNQLGWFGVQSYNSNSELNGIQVSSLGYPADIKYGFSVDAMYQYEAGDTITHVADRYFNYSAYTFAGFIGGPVIRSDNYIVGIHQGYNTVSNYATGVRITQEMINIIKSIDND